MAPPLQAPTNKAASSSKVRGRSNAKAGQGEETPQQVSQTSFELPSPPKPDTAPDDLTQLKGIGAVFCKRLYAIGVTHFVQIAEWTEADVAERSAQLKIPPSRIIRNNWIAQAQAIVAKAEERPNHG